MNEKSNKSKYCWVIVGLGFLVSFIGSYSQFQLAPLAYLIIPDLNITPVQFSSIFTSPMIPGILLSLVAGIISDRIGPKKAIAIAGVISVIGLALRVGANSYSTMFISMILCGVIATFFNANVAKILGSWFAPEKIGTMVGFAMAGATAAMAVGMGTTALFPGIKAAYIFALIFGVVTLVLWLLFAKDRPSGVEQEVGTAFEQPPVFTCLKVIIKNKNVWLTGLSLLFLLGASVCLSTFLPLVLNSERGLSATAAGVVTSVITIGNLIGNITGPMIAAKLGRMKPFIFVCAIITALGTAFAWLAPVGVVMIIVMFITGYTTSAMIPTFYSLPFLFPEVGPKYAGTAGGFVSTIQLIGCVVIPTYIISPLGSTNYVLLFILAGVSAVIPALLVLGLPEMLHKRAAK